MKGRLAKDITKGVWDFLRTRFIRLLSKLPCKVSPLRGYTTSDQLKSTDGLSSLIRLCLDKNTKNSSYIAVIKHGRVLFDYGVVTTYQKWLLSDFSIVFGGQPKDHAALRQIFLPYPQRFNGTLAVITSSGHQRYYHWLFDVIPRFILLQYSRVYYDAIVLNNELPFQHDTISMLGINPSLLISPKPNTHLVADSLVIPSLPGSGMEPSASTIHLLRRIFLESTESEKNRRRIYISRNDAETRRLMNEQRLLAYLTPLGFEVYYLSTLSMSEQVMLFAAASLIVAPHGAGLANLSFSMPECCVIELMPETYVVDCFKVICDTLNIRYRRVMCQPVVPANNSHDMLVRIADFKQVLDEFIAIS